MAHFDSPKNRAIWNKELNELREEREARAQGKVAIRKPEQAESTETGPTMRERISFEQLVEEERAVSGRRERVPAMTEPVAERSMESSMDLSR